VQINNSLDSAEKRSETEYCRVSEIIHGGKLFQTIWPDTLKHRPPYVDTLTRRAASWFLLIDLRQYRDDELQCDAE